MRRTSPYTCPATSNDDNLKTINIAKWRSGQARLTWPLTLKMSSRAKETSDMVVRETLGLGMLSARVV